MWISESSLKLNTYGASMPFSSPIISMSFPVLLHTRTKAAWSFPFVTCVRAAEARGCGWQARLSPSYGWGDVHRLWQPLLYSPSTTNCCFLVIAEKYVYSGTIKHDKSGSPHIPWLLFAQLEKKEQNPARWHNYGNRKWKNDTDKFTFNIAPSPIQLAVSFIAFICMRMHACKMKCKMQDNNDDGSGYRGLDPEQLYWDIFLLPLNRGFYSHCDFIYIIDGQHRLKMKVATTKY